mgnify:CR=1 FL=1
MCDIMCEVERRVMLVEEHLCDGGQRQRGVSEKKNSLARTEKS